MTDATPDAFSSNRRMNWFKRRPMMTAGLAAFLLLLIALVIGDYNAGRSLDRQLRAIREKGEPVTVRDLLAAEHPPAPNDNLTHGLILAVQPFVALKPDNEKLKQIPYLGLADPTPAGAHLSREQIDAGQWYLDQYPDALRDMHEACRRPAGWFDFRWSSPIVTVQWPELSTMRHAAKVLTLDAILPAERGDAVEAVRRLMDCYQSAKFMDANPYRSVIGNLVRVANGALALDTSARIINRAQLDDENLKMILAEVSPWCQPRDWAGAMVVERTTFIDTIDYWRSGAWSNRGLLLVPVMRHADEQVGVAWFTELIDVLRTPDPHTMDAVRAWRKRPPPPKHYSMTNTLLPDFNRSIDLGYRMVAEARVMSAAIACERFRIARQRWPKTLVELVPEYLAVVPLDPFDGKPIRYLEIPEGIKVWSISEDAHDDGGDLRRLEPYDRNKKRKDAGWVIVNPDRRAN